MKLTSESKKKKKKEKEAQTEMFGLDIALKENFLAYSTQFIFLIIRLVPGVVICFIN